MLVSLLPICHFPVPKASHVRGVSTANRPISRKAGKRMSTEKNFYELLNVSVDSEPREIKEAYRKLQKKYHPDIAGQEGHEYTLMLNEAYKVLMREDLRLNYNASIGQVRRPFNKDKSCLGYSTWNGPLRSQALFVDGNACIGCRECVHHASNTFIMDEALGFARVSVDSCPVNCIYWVDGEELPVLEFLIQPQPKEGYGVFGGGWERQKNVFEAAKYFNKHLKHYTSNEHQYGNGTHEEETPAQAEARVNASKKIRMERFSRLWNWAKEAFEMDMGNTD
ncbi:hypothetical protein TIFTF001_011749 [Ficus carica]|uniref:J domain-containing protein n=1 Tax=Ficus carica TaxID=3494 RepID=A0AA87ZSD2_FICCA|nr:hypothetical protein TIFTF001_011749 [Ficus carica]